MKFPTTKRGKLLLASKIIWNIGTILTIQYVLSANDNISYYVYPFIVIICYATQYVVTQIESALFSGAIPSPWSKDRSTKTTWIWCGAAIILALDVLINVGGVGYVAKFIKNSASGDILVSEFGATPTGIQIFSSFMIIAVALLVAVGSELLKMYAEMLEPSDEEIIDVVPFEEVKQIQKPIEINQSGLNPETLKQLQAARLAATQKQQQQPVRTIPVPPTRRNNK